MSENLLLESNLPSKNPFDIFSKWLEEATSAHPTSYFIMFVATVDPSGCPSNRPIALLDSSPDGLLFSTNRNSAKAREFGANSNVAVCFLWPPNQVRIQGTVSEVASPGVRQRLFEKVPEGNRAALSAFVHQSAPCSGGRAEIDGLLASATTDHNMKHCPEHWAAYCIRPNVFEFNHQHPDWGSDRLRFRRKAPSDVVDEVILHAGDDDWVFERLIP